MVERAPERLAVDRDHLRQARAELRHEALEGGVETLWIKIAEQPAKGIMAWNAVAQAQKPAQKIFLRLTEQRHVGAVLAATQHRAKRNHKQFVQIMARIVAARIDDIAKTGRKILHGDSIDADDADVPNPESNS